MLDTKLQKALDEVVKEIKSMDPSVLKQELENPNTTYIIAKEGNQVVGFAGISVCLDEATLNNIVVKKSCRGRGIGGELLESLIDICSELNLKTFTLEVNTKNEPAIHLYEKFGFVEVPLEDGIYERADIKMERIIC